MKYVYVLLLCLLFWGNGLHAQSPSELPRYEMGQLTYAGAFRIAASKQGISDVNYSEGPIAYNPVNNSLFIVGHGQMQAVAEYAVPKLITSERLADLNTAGAPLQTFSLLLNRTPDGNPQAMDRIGGMYYVDQPDSGQSKLFVNTYRYYDAAGSTTQTTLVVDDAGDLARSSLTGYLAFAGGAGHTSGWLSPIPNAWQSLLGGSHLTGQSSGIPIISRTSVGPSAFAFDVEEALDATDRIPTTKLLDFSLRNPLSDDLSNESGDNALWTHLSRATYGFIIPGTRTYLTLGGSGGHDSGVCYKCVQDSGNECGGYCPPEADDRYQYYWLWDVNDLVAVRSGTLQAHEVRPYDYGKFSTPFQAGGTKEIGGGSFDPATGKLYLSVKRGDTEQGRYATPPVIVVYDVNSKPGNDPTTDGNPLLLEAECATADAGWRTVNSPTTPGEQYRLFLGPPTYGLPTRQNSAQRLRFRMTIAETGDYRVYLRLNAPNRGHNSFWVRLDDGDWVKMWKDTDGSQLSTRGFAWKQVSDDGTPVTFNLTRGEHVLTVANRESGTELDKVFVTTNPGPPTGTGPTATNCGEASDTQAFVARHRGGVVDTELALYPSPVSDALTLRLDSEYAGSVRLRIIDATGRLLREVPFDKAAGVLLRQLDVRDLPRGLYRVQLIEGGARRVQSFVKTE